MMWVEFAYGLFAGIGFVLALAPLTWHAFSCFQNAILLYAENNQRANDLQAEQNELMVSLIESVKGVASQLERQRAVAPPKPIKVGPVKFDASGFEDLGAAERK